MVLPRRQQIRRQQQTVYNHHGVSKVLQATCLEEGQIVALDLKELESGYGLVGHLTCSADVLSLSAAQSLKSSFDVSFPLFKSSLADSMPQLQTELILICLV